MVIIKLMFMIELMLWVELMLSILTAAGDGQPREETAADNYPPSGKMVAYV